MTMNSVLKWVLQGLLWVMMVPRAAAMDGGVWDTIGVSFEKKPKFYVGLNSFNSFINKDRAKVTTLQLGLDWNKRVRLGIGFNGLNSNTNVVDRISVPTDSGMVVTNGNMQFGYVSVNAEYAYYKNYPWTFTVPLHLGFGNFHYSYILTQADGTRKGYQTADRPLTIFDVRATAQYNIFKWLGVGAGLGYRCKLSKNKNTRDQFSSPVYDIGLRIFFGEIYRAIFKR